MHYKIKEQFVYDKKRDAMVSVLIGICPVVKVNDEKIRLFWIYFPEASEQFAGIFLEDKNGFRYVSTLADLFFYHYYSGEIYRESNIYNKKISEYKSGDEIAREARRIELDIIEKEHDFGLKALNE